MELIEESEVNKLSLRKQGKRYLLYRKAIDPYIESIMEGIKISENSIVQIKEENLREMLEEHLKDNDIKTLRRALQHIFWDINIVVETKPRLSGKKNFYFRERNAFDREPK